MNLNTVEDLVLSMAPRHVHIPLPDDWRQRGPHQKVEWLLTLEYTTQLFPEYGRTVRELKTLQDACENLGLRAMHIEGLV